MSQQKKPVNRILLLSRHCLHSLTVLLENKILFCHAMDINEVFDSILLSEERISEEGYKQGFEKGVSEGNLEAYHLGKH